MYVQDKYTSATINALFIYRVKQTSDRRVEFHFSTSLFGQQHHSPARVFI